MCEYVKLNKKCKYRFTCLIFYVWILRELKSDKNILWELIYFTIYFRILGLEDCWRRMVLVTLLSATSSWTSFWGEEIDIIQENEYNSLGEDAQPLKEFQKKLIKSRGSCQMESTLERYKKDYQKESLLFFLCPNIIFIKIYLIVNLFVLWLWLLACKIFHIWSK